MTLPQVSAQPFFRVASDHTHLVAGIPIVEVVRPASQAAVHIRHHVPQRDAGQFPFRQFRQSRIDFSTALSDGRTFGYGLPDFAP